MVRHTSLGEIVGPNPFAPVACANLTFAGFCSCRPLSLLGQFENFCPQYPHCLVTVLELRFSSWHCTTMPVVSGVLAGLAALCLGAVMAFCGAHFALRKA